MNEPRTPSWLRALVERLLPDEYAAEFLADLDEELRRRATTGGSRLADNLWCLGQVARPDTLRLAARLRRRGRERDRGPRALCGGIADDVWAAARSLRRNPAHALLASVTLALGIGATTAMYSAVDAVVLRPFPYDVTERMYDFRRQVGSMMFTSATQEQIEAWGEQDDVIEGFLRTSVTRPILTGAGPAERIQVGRTRSETFELLGVRPALGRAFSAGEEVGEAAKVVLLTHDVWRSRFGGDPGVLGRTVSLSGEPWEVIGVMPPRTPFPAGRAVDVEFWAPLPDADIESSSAMAIVREGVTLPELQAGIDLVRDRAATAGESTEPWEATAVSVADELGSWGAEPLRILAAAVVLVLMIALVNVANLLLGRASLRRTETSVRSALGGSRQRLMRQLMFESLMLGLAGALLGLAVAYGTVEVVQALRPADMALLDQTRIDGRVLGLSAVIGILGAILFGIIPAWHGTREGSLAVLRGSASLERRGVAARRSRWLLVGSEVALSFALLVGSVMALRALYEFQSRDLGFAADDVLIVSAALPWWEYDEPMQAETQERFEYLIEAQSGVIDVSRTGQVPLVGGGFVTSATFQVEGADPYDTEQTLLLRNVEADIFRVMGIPILEGRAFTEAEVTDEAPVAILEESTARVLFGDEPAVGKRFRYRPSGTWYTVVGIAPRLDPDGSGNPELLLYHPGAGSGVTYTARIAPEADPRTVLAAITRTLRAEAPNVMIQSARTAREIVVERAARERFTSVLLTGFAVLALALSVVGLYGVVASLIGQRTRELGIRISLGADRTAIRRLVLGEGAWVTAVGIVVGGALAWVGLRVLSSRIFGLDSGHMVSSYAVAAALLALASLAACWVPSQRAVRVDPVEALRRE